MTINIDADIRNADWIKVRVWDLPTTIDEFWPVLGPNPEAGWAHFQTLPAFTPMPTTLRLEVEIRLLQPLKEHLREAPPLEPELEEDPGQDGHRITGDVWPHYDSPPPPEPLEEHLSGKHDQKSHAGRTGVSVMPSDPDRRGSGTGMRPAGQVVDNPNEVAGGLGDAPGLMSSASPAARAQVIKTEAEIRGLRGHERLVAIDPKSGKVLFDTGDKKGTSIDVTAKMDRQMKGAIVIHNHPRGWGNSPTNVLHNGSSFSTDDMYTASRAGVAEMRVVTPTRTFVARPGTDKNWGPTAMGEVHYDTFATVFHADSRVRADLESRIFALDSDTSPDWASSEHHNIMWRDHVAPKLGWEYLEFRGDNFVEAVLDEHLSGKHNQKSHGKSGTLGVADSMSGLHPEAQAAIRARAAAMGIDQGAMTDRMVGIYGQATPSQRKEGMEWYDSVGDHAAEVGGQYGIGRSESAAVYSVLSPVRSWESNLIFGEAVLHTVGRNEPFHVSAELGSTIRPPTKGKFDPADYKTLKPGTYKPSDLTAPQLAWTHPDLRSTPGTPRIGGLPHYKQIATGVRIARGDISPNMALTGPKTRSFHNNLYDPRDRTSVTVDDWMYRTSLGKDTTLTVTGAKGTAPRQVKSGDFDYGDLGALMLQGPARASVGYPSGSGLYPLFADSISAGAAKVGVLPQQFQAVVWVTARDMG